MLARLHTSAVLGIDAYPVQVDVDVSSGQGKVKMVGLPDATVKESEDRVMSAIRNSGFYRLRGHVVVSLHPADMRKEGSALDLPIALGMLAASEQCPSDRFADYLVAGELALDGQVRPVVGALAMALAARNQKKRGILVPAANAEEAGVVQGIDVIPVHTLNDAADFMLGRQELMPHVTDIDKAFNDARAGYPELSEVKGQAHVKRALTVAAAGNHNLLTLAPI